MWHVLPGFTCSQAEIGDCSGFNGNKFLRFVQTYQQLVAMHFFDYAPDGYAMVALQLNLVTNFGFHKGSP